MEEKELKRLEEECIGILKDESRTEGETEKFSENFKDLVEAYSVEYSCELEEITAGELIDYYDSNFSQEEAQCISDKEALSAFDMGRENKKGSIIKTTTEKADIEKDDNITKTIKKNIKKKYTVSPEYIRDLPNNTTGSKIQIPRLPDDKRFTCFLIHKKIIKAICYKDIKYGKVLEDKKFEVFLFNNFMIHSNLELLEINQNRRLIKEDEKLEICAYYNYLRTQQKTNKEYDTQNAIDFEYWIASRRLIAEATYTEDEASLNVSLKLLNKVFEQTRKSMSDNIEALAFIDENFPREFTYENIIESCSYKKFKELIERFKPETSDKIYTLFEECASQCRIKFNFEISKKAITYLEKRDKGKQFQLQPRKNSEKRYILMDFYRRLAELLNEKYQNKDFDAEKIRDKLRTLRKAAKEWNSFEKLLNLKK